MRLLLGLALALLWLAPLPASAAARTYAIVVGNNEPPASPAGDGLHALRFADDDAIRYAQFLNQFADDVRLHTVLDGQTRKRFDRLKTHGPPSLASLRGSLAALGEVAQARRDDGDHITFYLVFSAHGAIADDGGAFISLLDAPLSRAVLFDEILAQIPADRVHLIIDACHAAGVVGLRGKRSFGKEVEGDVDEVSEDEAERWVATRTLSRFPHVGVLAATTASEQAHEWSAIESGVFSHEVLSALWGAGDINGDLRVEYSEVRAFVAAANRRVEDPKAVPTVVSRPPPDDPHDPVSDLSLFQQSVMITGDASTLGHFHIERRNGQRHLDANLDGATTVAIPSGSTAYLRTGEEEIVLKGTAGEVLDLADLPRRDSEVTARGSGSAYRRALFREPFTPDYYRGYVDSVGGSPVKFSPRPKPKKKKPPSPKVALTPTAPPPVDRRRTPEQRRRGAGITFAVIAGGTGVASIVTGALAGSLRAQFNATEVEADAKDLQRRHTPLAAAAISTGVVAVGATVLAVVLLKRKR